MLTITKILIFQNHVISLVLFPTVLKLKFRYTLCTNLIRIFCSFMHKHILDVHRLNHLELAVKNLSFLKGTPNLPLEKP